MEGTGLSTPAGASDSGRSPIALTPQSDNGVEAANDLESGERDMEDK